VRLRIDLEDGGRRDTAASVQPRDERAVDGRPWRAYDVPLALALPLGYHRLSAVASDGATVASSVLAVTPAACYRPPGLRGGRAFGAAVQLYGVRSGRNWGIGDFTDLADLVRALGARGAGIVGVNPLHALFPHNPSHASPYSPSSRLFANTLYLDVEAVDDFATSEAARALVASSALQDRLRALRDAALVDHAGVAAAKREVLELVYQTFRERRRNDASHAFAFDAFVRDGGEPLRLHALFEALQEHLHAEDPARWGWPAWPARYRDPAAPDVARFAREHAERVDYYTWLQWQADRQRAVVASRARDAGLAVGLYTDLAVSIDRGGAESWAGQALYAAGASVGAPPDAFNTEGQDWGLPPLVPSRLVAAGYAPFLATLRANMRHAGALRIDHVMGLMRLFWVPPGGKPVDGAYVAYPFTELLSLLALESVRHRCLVIGEDLGTVPDEVRAALAAHDVLSYRVLLFERTADGEFKPPASYPEAALATASTHDLPALAGWWEGADLETRTGLGLMTPDERERERWHRGEDRARLLRALREAGLWSDAGADAAPSLTPALASAIVSFLASTPSALAVFQLEDLLLVREQANVPGTVDEHPNWRRKLPKDVDRLFDDATFVALLRQLAALRPPPPHDGTTR
jgi:(1->4)-alpha-D-glucan 1-alpha-D-glucosylmutase